MPAQLKPTGSQAGFRALNLLKLVGMNHEGGVVLRYLVETSGLDRTTTYRLINCMVETGMMERENTKRYRMGLEAQKMGMKSMSRVHILERCWPKMIRCAVGKSSCKETGDKYGENL